MLWEECAIVDDNKFDRLISNRIVSRINPDLKIKEYQSGREILTYLTSASFVSTKMLILLDINMPIMNGFEFLHALEDGPYEEIRDRLSVAVITSSTRKQDFQEASKFQVVKSFIQKPLKVEDLHQFLVGEVV